MRKVANRLVYERKQYLQEVRNRSAGEFVKHLKTYGVRLTHT